MPMIRYRCTGEKCGHSFTKLVRKGPDALPELACVKCGENSKRVLGAPASASKIVVDNGLQARSVEIYPDIEDINYDRARKPFDRGD